MGIQFVERPVASVEELQAGVRAIRVGEVDAFFQLSDPMVQGQAQLIIDTARRIRLPTMFVDQSFVVKGALAAYSVSYREVGRLSAKYVQRILAGVKPKDLPVQQVDKSIWSSIYRPDREADWPDDSPVGAVPGG